MDIAILRTDRADQDGLYNPLEYRAALAGARVVAYLAADGSGEFRGLPQLCLDHLSDVSVDLIVAASPLTADLRRLLTSRGWPEDRLLSFATESHDCVARWDTAAPGLSWRDASEWNGVAPRQRHARIDGMAVEDMPSPLSTAEQRALAERVFAAHRRATRNVPGSGPYATAGFWDRFIQTTRPAYRDCMARGDISSLSALLASCFRNEMTTGMFSGHAAYDAFNRFVLAGADGAGKFRQVFNVWRHSVPVPDLSRVASPLVGNPYGWWVDGRVVHQNTFLNDYRAASVNQLLDDVAHPIVVEIGGGYGGFGRQLVATRARCTYVGFDLPDNLLVASYVLLAAHPDKRVLLYESFEQTLDPDTLRQYDIVLMPHFMVPRLEERSVDGVVNFISLSEMERAAIAEYHEQIERVCGRFFYHENLIDSGHRFAQTPVAAFPRLDQFKQVFSAPSRWPFFGPTSPVHCHGEFLHVRRA